MIEDKFVDLYARNSGLRDKLVAERDVVLTYALRALLDAGVMDHLAFKGGTCLRKLIFGSAGRFSEDLDFSSKLADISKPVPPVPNASESRKSRVGTAPNALFRWGEAQREQRESNYSRPPDPFSAPMVSGCAPS